MYATSMLWFFIGFKKKKKMCMNQQTSLTLVKRKKLQKNIYSMLPLKKKKQSQARMTCFDRSVYVYKGLKKVPKGIHQVR